MFLFLNLLLSAHAVLGYKFSLAAEPTQCGNLTVHWQGGQVPFELLLVPVGHVTPELRTIVDQTASSGSSISLQLKFPANSRFVASLSDASGVGAGGTSDILTVGDGPADCLSGPVQAGWVLYMDDVPPSQCAATRVSWDTSAKGPVSMWGIIPGGDTFDMGAPSSGTGWDWTPNVAAGTQMLIVAGDSEGRGTGGSTDIFTVGAGNNGCINGDSPDTTEDPAAGQVVSITATDSGNSTPTVSSSSSPTDSSSNGNNGHSNNGHNSGDDTGEDDAVNNGNGNQIDGDDSSTNPAAQDPPSASSSSPNGATIAGIVLGTLAVILLLLLGLFFCVRTRRRRQRQSSSDGITNMRGRGDLLASEAPSIASGGVDSVFTRAPHENVPRVYETTPFVMRPRGGAWESSNSGHAGAALARSPSGYSADISDRTSTRGGHGAPIEHDFADALLLAPSPFATPTAEKSAYLNPFSDHAAALVPTQSPPSFKTMATRGHTRNLSSRSATSSDAESMHEYPVVHRAGQLTLVPHGGVSTWTLGEAEVPPSYDSVRKPAPINPFVTFGESEDKTSSSTSGH